MNKFRYSVLAWLAVSFITPSTWAVQLDTSFGDAGYVYTNVTSFNGDNDSQPKVLVQTDGKIAIAGVSDDTILLIRYNSDGTTDTGFGENGQATKGIVNLSSGSVAGLVEQGDGKIVVAAYHTAFHDPLYSDDIVLFRVHSDGTIDDSFGTDGLVSTDTGGSDFVFSIIRQTDGKLVVAGYSDNQMSLFRYTKDGVLDTGFGVDGIALLNDESIAFSGAYAVVQQPDGKLVAAGGSHIARFNTNGTLDTSFDTDGWNTMPAGMGGAFNLAFQSNGQFAVTGHASGDIAVTRFNDDGSLDTDFGTAGLTTTDVSGSDIGYGIVPNISDGKIVITGWSGSGDTRIVVLRYDADGILDTSFATDGIAELDLGIYGEKGIRIVQQTDNKYVLAGEANYGGGADFVTARYNYDGTLDTGFNSNGYRVDWRGTKAKDVGYALIVQSDGKLIAGGASRYVFTGGLEQPADIAMTRYLADGTLDTDFADNGSLVDSIMDPYSGVRGMINQTDDKIVSLIQTYDGATTGSALIRYDSNGARDTSFGTGGTGIVALDHAAYSGVQLSSGKLLLTAPGSLQRFDLSGNPDAGFGNQGVVTPTVCPCSNGSFVEQAGGKLVIAGINGVERYLESGALDVSFATAGKLSLPEGISWTWLVQQSDGKLIVAFFSEQFEDGNTLILMRFSAEGNLDTTFGDAGVTTTYINDSPLAGSIFKLVLQEDGKTVIFIRFKYDDFQLLRYNTNGLLDTSFDNDGVYVLPFTQANYGGTALVGDMLYQPGYFTVFIGNQDDFFMARFIDIDLPPVAGAVVANDVAQVNFGDTTYSLNIDYSDANGDLDTSTIQASNITVCNGGSCAAVTGAVWNGDTSTGTATYTMTPPGGSWDAADNGTYTIAILPTEVGDSLTAWVEENTNAGSFTVSIVDPTQPGAPVIVSATAANTGALIAFTPPVDDGGADIIDYTAVCNGGVDAVGAASPLLVQGLTNGIEYECYVYARNSVGTGASSAMVMVTPSDGGEVTLPPPDGGSGEPVTFTHTAIPPGGGEPVAATLSVIATQANPPEPPAEAESLVAAIDISSTSDVIGYTLVVSFTIDASSINEFTGFWKYGKEIPEDDPHWYDYGTLAANGDGTGYVLSGNKKTLTVYLVDGLRGDDDLLANASIVDPALPIVQVAPVPSCNVTMVTGATEYFDATHEACEILVLGPDYIVADGSNISVNSGWEIDFISGFTVEQGATLNASVCGQSLCLTSDSPMPYGCHSCVDQICDIDATCCTEGFDQACLDRVSANCGLVCE